MSDKKIKTVDDIRTFLEGTVEVEFSIADGSEYINHRVAELLEKLHIEFTKSRPRHSNDNALAESKNGTIGLPTRPRCQRFPRLARLKYRRSPEGLIL